VGSSNKNQKQKFRFTLTEVRSLQRRAGKLELSTEARKRLRWFEYFLSHKRNVSLTCRYYGISRSTFLRWANRFVASDLSTLEDQSRRPHSVRAPETPVHIVALIKNYRTCEPTISKESITEKLKENNGVRLSSATVGRVIQRNGFFFGDTPAHKMKRKAALEKLQSVGFENVQARESVQEDEDIPPSVADSPFPLSPQLPS
jgi:transposase